MLSRVITSLICQMCISPSPIKLTQRTAINSLKSNKNWANSLLVAEAWPRRDATGDNLHLVNFTL